MLKERIRQSGFMFDFRRLSRCGVNRRRKELDRIERERVAVLASCLFLIVASFSCVKLLEKKRKEKEEQTNV